MSRLLLSLDSSTPWGSVALTRGDQVLAEMSLNAAKVTHSDYLLPFIDQVLHATGFQREDLEALAVVVGPGSFTGLRVGLATVQGLALALGCPVYPVSSLQAVAFANGPSQLPVCVLLDARKKEVYTATYRWQQPQLIRCGTEQVLPPQQVVDAVDEKTLFVGNGAWLYAEMCHRAGEDKVVLGSRLNTVPRAAAVGLLVEHLGERAEAVEPFQLTPVYVRPSDAEMQASGN